MGDHRSLKSSTLRFRGTETPMIKSSLALFCLSGFLLHEHYWAGTQIFTVPPVFHFKFIILYYFPYQGYHISNLIKCNIYTVQQDTQCSCTDCLLILRCQLYMFRTVTVRPQELLFRCCMCRLWYVLIRPAGTTFE